MDRRASHASIATDPSNVIKLQFEKAQKHVHESRSYNPFPPDDHSITRFGDHVTTFGRLLRPAPSSGVGCKRLRFYQMFPRRT